MLSILTFGDIRFDRHIADQGMIGVVTWLDLHLDPVVDAGFGAIQQFALEGEAVIQCLANGEYRFGLGIFALQQLARRLTQYIVVAVTGDTLEAVIDPGDTPLRIGQNHRVRGVTGDQSQTLQIGGHIEREAFGSVTAKDLLA